MNLAAAIVISATLFGQTPANPTTPPSTPAVGQVTTAPEQKNALAVSSALDFVLKGGWPMVPIGLCSLVALAIIIERSLTIRSSRVVPQGFVKRAMDAAGDTPRALELCRSNGSPIARVFAEAIKRRNEPQELMEKHVEEVGGRELVPLRQRMRLLSALPQVSTMLGLLGTVFGMIKTFQQVAVSSEALGKTEKLADGIFEAWTCTAGGLLVAIPVLIAFHWLMGKIDAITADVDETASLFVDRLRPGASASPSSRVNDGSRAGSALHADGVASASAASV